MINSAILNAVPMKNCSRFHAKITYILILSKQSEARNCCKVCVIDADALTVMLKTAWLHMNTNLQLTIRLWLDELTS
jgi:hypothetical protein